MSDLLNIAMPKTCEACPCNDDNWRCGATGEYFDYDDMYERRRADCPLIEIPTPHGRLIDADKLNTYDLSPVNGFCVMGVTEEDIGLADTVIEAED